MGYYELLDKTFGNLPPIVLAIIIDLLKLIPYVDFVITVPLAWILWSKLDVDVLKFSEIGYDLVGDIIVPGIGDIFPLNTVCVSALELSGKLKK